MIRERLTKKVLDNMWKWLIEQPISVTDVLQLSCYMRMDIVDKIDYYISEKNC